MSNEENNKGRQSVRRSLRNPLDLIWPTGKGSKRLGDWTVDDFILQARTRTFDKLSKEEAERRYAAARELMGDATFEEAVAKHGKDRLKEVGITV